MRSGYEVADVNNTEDYKQLKKEVEYQIKKSTSPHLTLAERLDVAYEIHLRCEKLNAYGNKPDKKIIQQNTKALYLLESVLGFVGKDKIHELMRDRGRKRFQNPEYIPGPHNIDNLTTIADSYGLSESNRDVRPAELRASYNWRNTAKQALMIQRKQALTVGDKDARRDEIDNIKMHHAIDRDSNRVFIQNGLVLQRDKTNMVNEFDTGKMSAHGKRGIAGITINLNGEISVFNHLYKEDKVAHSTMNSGRATLYAGEVKIEKGKITVITDHSGHYRPEVSNIYILLKYLKKNGVDINTILIDVYKNIPGLKRQTEDSVSYENSRNLYRAPDILEYMERLERENTSRKVSELKIKLITQLMIDTLQDAHPEMTSINVSHVSTTYGALQLLNKSDRKHLGDFIIIRENKSEPVLTLCYYDDSGRYTHEKYSIQASSTMGIRDIHALNKTITLLKETEARKSDPDAFQESALIKCLNARDINATLDQFKMDRKSAESFLASNPGQIVIRRSSRPGYVFCVSYVKNNKCGHQLLNYSIDPKFSAVQVSDKTITGIIRIAESCKKKEQARYCQSGRSIFQSMSCCRLIFTG